MTPKQALTKARKILGAKATITIEPYPSSPEARTTAKAALIEHRANKPEPVTKEWRDRQSKLIGETFYYRCRVGRIVMGLFNEIAGEGDTLDEALEAVSKREAA